MSIFEYDEELHKQTLLEEGFEKGMKQAVLELLEELGSVPEDIRKKILSEENLETLKKWHKAAAKAETVDQFSTNM